MNLFSLPKSQFHTRIHFPFFLSWTKPLRSLHFSPSCKPLSASRLWKNLGLRDKKLSLFLFPRLSCLSHQMAFCFRESSGLFYRLGFHSLPRRPEGDQRVTPIRHLLHAYFVSLVWWLPACYTFHFLSWTCGLSCFVTGSNRINISSVGPIKVCFAPRRLLRSK